MTLTPSAEKTASKDAANFASRSWIRNLAGEARSVSPEAEVPHLLSDPGASGVGGDAGEMADPGVQLDEEEYVERWSKTVSTLKKSDPSAWARDRCDAGAGSPRRSRGEGDAPPGELSTNPPVAPGRVLLR